MPDVFISYSRKDDRFARQLATDLHDLDLDLWLDVDDIPPGMRWSTAVQTGLDVSDIMLLVLSPDSMGSRHVEDEWQYFLDNRKPVIPLLLRPTNVHYQLSRIHYIDFYRQPYEAAFRQLHAILLRLGLHLKVDTSEIRAVPLLPQPPLAVIGPGEPLSKTRARPLQPAYSLALTHWDVPTVPTRLHWETTRPVNAVIRRRRRGLLLAVMFLLVMLVGAYVLHIAAVDSSIIWRDLSPPVWVIGVPDATVEVPADTPLPSAAPTRTRTTNPTVSTAPPPTRLIVTNAGAVSLREGPSTLYRRISQAERGAQLTVIGRNSARTWWLVRDADDRPLWLSSIFAVVEPADAAVPLVDQIGIVITDASVLIYAEPTDEALVIATVPAEARLPLLRNAGDRADNWLRVLLPNQRTGWLPADDVTPRYIAFDDD